MAFERAHSFGMDRADFALTCAGCALAVVLSVTAGMMVLRRTDDRPRVNGSEHFALFAQPTRLHDERVMTQAPLFVPPSVQSAPTRGIDFAPTAAIAPIGRPLVSPPAATVPPPRFGATAAMGKRPAARRSDASITIRGVATGPRLARVKKSTRVRR